LVCAAGIPVVEVRAIARAGVWHAVCTASSEFGQGRPFFAVDCKEDVMSLRLRRSTISALSVFVLLSSRETAAQPSEGVTAPAAAIEIDRAALVIDVAAERRALDAAIRSELARRAAAERGATRSSRCRARARAAEARARRRGGVVLCVPPRFYKGFTRRLGSSC
jgi:hypothetical protein